MTAVEDTFAGYRIEGTLGQGGMGTVYRARHPRLPRTVALKLLNRAVSEDPELRRRFEQEADIVAGLDHPGIVGVYDRGTHDGHLWISMRFIEGTDAARLDPHTPPERLLRYLAETAEALDYAHRHGVLHRDVKPANILIADPGDPTDSRALLTDFGIARLVEADTKLTATGTFTATLAYASPEQLAGEVVDHRSDQYSLACTLYMLLTGQPPFAAANPAQVIAGHLSQPVPPAGGVRPGLPAALDAVLARAMAKRRDDRFGSCREFVDAARNALLHNAFPTPAGQAYAGPTPARGYPHHAQGGPPLSAGPMPQGGLPLPNGAGWAGPAYPAAPRVSGSDAKTTAVLAILIGLISGFLGLSLLGHLLTMQPTDSRAGSALTYDQDRWMSATVVILFLPPSILALTGAAALLLRRKAGRILILTAAILLSVLPTAAAVVMAVIDDPYWLIACVFIVFLPLLTFFAARSKGTRNWLEQPRY
ncbi:serine/threonine-protein kinase [Nocardia sp. NPDC059177]|uniref:serine/threonine-protein kinase n=1 Tax=Nocardia sp. NPDC059177 TaxID=3346759 RepID=UPI0036D1AD09